MRENCTYGSEGGDGERRSRPLSCQALRVALSGVFGVINRKV